MATGTVHTWSAGRGSGWIKSDGGGDRIYVHKSGIEGATAGVAPRLEVGQRVEFQIGQRPKGSAAVNVRPAPEATTPTEPAGEGATDVTVAAADGA
jgi:CspA family cold shock protein